MVGPVYRVMSKVLKELSGKSLSAPCPDFVRHARLPANMYFLCSLTFFLFDLVPYLLLFRASSDARSSFDLQRAGWNQLRCVCAQNRARSALSAQEGVPFHLQGTGFSRL